MEAYRMPSPAALAARQLQEIGCPAQSGKRVPLLYTLGKPGATAWHERIPLDENSIDHAYYCRLLIRAAVAVLQPFGLDERALTEYLLADGVVQIPLELEKFAQGILL